MEYFRTFAALVIFTFFSMKGNHKYIISTLLAGLSLQTAFSQNALQRSFDGVEYSVEAQTTFSKNNSPLWLNANRYGLSSVDRNNGYLRVGIQRDASLDQSHKWRFGYGADFAAAYQFTSPIVIQQLYLDIDYLKMRLSIGSKERPMAFKNQELSSGSQTFGINARPIPEVRFEVPEYLSITGKSNWAAIKGHFGYGMMTDGRWQKDYVNDGVHYAKGALYHSKAGYLRIGNEEKFPLVFEGGLEMACQFGGTIYNPIGANGASSIKMGHSIKDFFKVAFGMGSDATDGIYANASGNTLGSWLLSLSYKGKDWKVRAYYDHFFEDHSMMFFEYGWLDGLIGAEITLPQNPILQNIVYEYINTTYQSGPVYHDHTDLIPDQISGIDNYYNHNLYQGWQHWGQAIGNPLFHSPLYRNDGSLVFSGNRFKAHHIGLSAQPFHNLDWRILYSYMENWGRYEIPYMDKRYCHSFLAEINYRLPEFKNEISKGWSISAAFALDRGKELNNNTGAQITIRKSGLLLK